MGAKWLHTKSPEVQRLYHIHANNCPKLVAALHDQKPRRCRCDQPGLKVLSMEERASPRVRVACIAN
jgi:hypothetical protein